MAFGNRAGRLQHVCYTLGLRRTASRRPRFLLRKESAVSTGTDGRCNDLRVGERTRQRDTVSTEHNNTAVGEMSPLLLVVSMTKVLLYLLCTEQSSTSTPYFAALPDTHGPRKR